MKKPNRNYLKNECPQGHPYDNDNTYFYRGRRYCRRCKHAAVRKARQK